jgi:hypothetical protein
MNDDDSKLLQTLVEKYGKVTLINNINKDIDYEDTMGIIRFWKHMAQKYFGLSPYINYGRTIKLLKNNLKQLKREDIENIIEYYCEWYGFEGDKYPLSINAALSEWFINKYLSEKEKYGN